jgi:hypothetical protein
MVYFLIQSIPKILLSVPSCPMVCFRIHSATQILVSVPCCILSYGVFSHSFGFQYHGVCPMLYLVSWCIFLLSLFQTSWCLFHAVSCLMVRFLIHSVHKILVPVQYCTLSHGVISNSVCSQDIGAYPILILSHGRGSPSACS